VLFGVLRAEAMTARRRVLRHEGIADPPNGTGVWGQGSRPPLTLALLGDSSAVGRGVELVTETPGVLLAHSLSGLAGQPVRLVQVAVTGSESSDLSLQVGRALPESPDVAVIMIGTNDVTARVSATTAVSHLRQAVVRLRQAGCEVVVGTCPDLGTLRPMPQPLRRIGRRWSRQLAAAQTVVVVEAGGRTVSLGSLLGPEFDVLPELFSQDHFHPSADGYAAAAAVMLPSVAVAIGVAAPSHIHDLSVPSGGVRPVAAAAATAAEQPGTEVSATATARPARLLREVGSLSSVRRLGSRGGSGALSLRRPATRGGSWALLLRRRPATRGGSWALSMRRRPARMPTPEEAAGGGEHAGAQTKGQAI